MEAVTPTVMLREVEALAGDMRRHTQLWALNLRSVLSVVDVTSVRTVYLIGSGDSYHASTAAALAFETIAGLRCEAMSALPFLTYHTLQWDGSGRGQVLVVATSASGRTPRVIEAVSLARNQGALTLALTTRADSTISQVAERTLVLDLPARAPSPAIRTYHASVVGLTLLAIHLGETMGRYGPIEATGFCQELESLAAVVDATNAAISQRSREVAKWVAHVPVVMIVGSGPSYGTARYCAAKLIEAAGLPAIGQDLEEWWHVERFVDPVDMPVFLIAPPGRSYSRAVEFASAARQLGRRVIAVTQADDHEIAPYAEAILPVQGVLREEFSPLVYHLFASHVACYIAQELGRLPFQSRRTFED